MRRPFLAGFALAAALLTGACSPNTTGTPQPVANPSTAPSSQAGGSPLTLTGVDPCALVTSAQQKQLNAGPGEPRGNNIVLNTPQCAFQIGSGYSFDITTDYAHGIANWQGRLAKTSPAKFGDYNAVRIINPVQGCSFAVETAPNQELVVDYLTPNDTNETSEQMCPDAKKYTEAALSTLKSSK